jgi:pyruvate dehydrogenase E2 component (dihydrolipoamide acetyltransferase)
MFEENPMIEVKVPDIGDFEDVPVIEIHVKPGDRVDVETALLTLESDKATMDVPSPVAGVIQALKVSVGDKVREGSVIVSLEPDTAHSAQDAPQEPAAVAAEAVPPSSASTAPDGDSGTVVLPSPAAAITATIRPDDASLSTAPSTMHLDMGSSHASPSVRRFARDLGVDLTRVPGTGPKGRITPDDVRAYVKRSLLEGERAITAMASGDVQKGTGSGGLNLLPWPVVDFAKFGPVERAPLSRIKKISGPNLSRNWVMIPAVTYHEEADITDLEAFRVEINRSGEKSGVKVTMLAFLIKACVVALQRYPELNASLDEDHLVLKRYWHIGFAADTPNGLVVPVLKNADQKGILDISRELAELSQKAREGKLAPPQMQGASFTVSSLGGIGGTYFSPIVNAPEVAILGVNKSTFKPVWDGHQFVPRLLLPLSLSADHRVVDGALATRFNVCLADLLKDFRRVSL